MKKEKINQKKTKCKLCEEFYKMYPPVFEKGLEDDKKRLVHKLPNCTMAEIQCAFETEIFSKDNWNCCTLDLIRDLCYEGQKLHPYINYQYCEDQKYAIFNISYLDEIDGDALWISWYKNRGKTDSIWILDSYNIPRLPTEEECILISKYFKRR
jgi:hypothetical protein